MSLFVFIRHAQKLYDNGKSETYPFDPSLTSKGIEKSYEVAAELIEKFGQPDLILCSPYLRTRQTAEIFASQCQSSTQIMIDRDLSEFLGNQESLSINDVLPETWENSPYPPETMQQFQTRVRRFYNSVKRDANSGLVFVITHGIFLNTIARIRNKQIKKRFGYLEHYYIKVDDHCQY